MFTKSLKREEGQGLVEYALILVLVAIVVIAILLQLGPELRATFGRITAVLSRGGVITNSGSITDVQATYSPRSGSLTINVTLSDTPTDISLSGDATGSQSCSSSPCSITVSGVPANGQVIVRDSGGGEGVVAYW